MKWRWGSHRLVATEALAGFPVVGYDIDQEKIELLRRGESYLKHLGTDFVQEMAKSPSVRTMPPFFMSVLLPSPR